LHPSSSSSSSPSPPGSISGFHLRDRVKDAAVGGSGGGEAIMAAMLGSNASSSSSTGRPPGDPMPTQLQPQSSCSGTSAAGAAAAPAEVEDGDMEWYTFGIIDILQEFNARKQAEAFVKTQVLGNEDVSAINPSLYARRFQGFVKQHTS
jgi:hypothetical protein